MPMSLIMRDDVFDLLGVDDVVGQVVVDLGVGEVAALLAEHDQVLQARAAGLGVLFRHLRRDGPFILAAAAALALGLDLRDLGFEELERLLGARLDRRLRRLGRLRIDLGRGFSTGAAFAVGASFFAFSALLRWCLAFSAFLGAGRAFATGRFSARTTCAFFLAAWTLIFTLDLRFAGPSVPRHKLL